MAALKRSLTTASVALILAASIPASALSQVQAPRQNAPSFFVRLEVNHATRSYREGDTLSVTAVSEIDCYAYVLYTQSDGKSFQIFPNSSQPDNKLKARRAVSIPSQDDLFRWQVAAPFGEERITLLCCKEPLDAMSAEELRAKRFNPVSKERLKGIELEIGQEEPAAWGIDEIELTTFPRSAAARTTDHKRVGVFFGVAQYQFNIEAEAASGRGLNLATCHRDARQMAAVLKEVGELAETRTFTNAEATRQNLEQSLTSWLPQVTRPGDTVVVYFSGHGMKARDESGDEADGEDEVLVPYDFVDLGILNEAVKRSQAGTLDAANGQRADQALDIVKRAGSIEKGGAALLRETAVSDDLFAHWLQRLAGRQVIVVLDICFAGGFATPEKDLFATGQPKSFDFVDGELSRLKDLGQKELALLASSSSLTTSAVRRENDLSVMTYYLLEALQAAPAQVTLEGAHQHCKRAMQAYFERMNQQAEAAGKPKLQPHEPQLFNFSVRPVFLKP